MKNIVNKNEFRVSTDKSCTSDSKYAQRMTDENMELKSVTWKRLVLKENHEQEKKKKKVKQRKSSFPGTETAGGVRPSFTKVGLECLVVFILSSYSSVWAF